MSRTQCEAHRALSRRDIRPKLTKPNCSTRNTQPEPPKTTALGFRKHFSTGISSHNERRSSGCPGFLPIFAALKWFVCSLLSIIKLFVMKVQRLQNARKNTEPPLLPDPWPNSSCRCRDNGKVLSNSRHTHSHSQLRHLWRIFKYTSIMREIVSFILSLALCWMLNEFVHLLHFPQRSLPHNSFLQVHIQGGQCGNQIGAKFWEVVSDG